MHKTIPLVPSSYQIKDVTAAKIQRATNTLSALQSSAVAGVRDITAFSYSRKGDNNHIRNSLLIADSCKIFQSRRGLCTGII